MILAQSILEIVEQVMKSDRATKILRIYVTAEKMSLVLPASLQSCFEILTKDTRLGGAVLEINLLPFIYYCPNCNQVVTSEDMIVNCGFCGLEDPIPVSGRLVRVDGIDMVDEVLKNSAERIPVRYC